MSDALVSMIAGAVGGLLVIFLERFLFRARSSWEQARLSHRFLRRKVEQGIGRQKVWCPKCESDDTKCHDVGVDPIENELTGEIVNGVVWANYSCRDCGHAWSIEPEGAWPGPERDDG